MESELPKLVSDFGLAAWSSLHPDDAIKLAC
jgi:hypothetical protein